MASNRQKQRLDRETIAMRAAKELTDGSCVNLGGGIPTRAAAYVPVGSTVWFESENGLLGFVAIDPERDEPDWDYYDASGNPVKMIPGGSLFDSVESFCMIRGGHLDATILGGYQVSEKGDLANWMRPEEGIGSIGGAADLALGPKKVIVCMEHTTKEGKPRIVKECTYPLTGVRCVDVVITDIGVIEVTEEGLVLKEVAPGWTSEEVQALTEAKVKVAEDLKEITL